MLWELQRGLVAVAVIEKVECCSSCRGLSAMAFIERVEYCASYREGQVLWQL